MNKYIEELIEMRFFNKLKKQVFWGKTYKVKTNCNFIHSSVISSVLISTPEWNLVPHSTATAQPQQLIFEVYF